MKAHSKDNKLKAEIHRKAILGIATVYVIAESLAQSMVTFVNIQRIPVIPNRTLANLGRALAGAQMAQYYNKLNRSQTRLEKSSGVPVGVCHGLLMRANSA